MSEKVYPLTFYDTARRALAEAARFDDVKAIRDKTVAVQTMPNRRGMQLRGNKSKARQAGKAMAMLFGILARMGGSRSD